MSVTTVTFLVKVTSCLFLCRENDVAGIDVNMGCPKDYSVKVQSVSCIIISQWYCLISVAVWT